MKERNSMMKDNIFSLLMRLGILFGLFFLSMVIFSFIAGFIEKADFSQRDKLLTVSALQAIFVFILSAWLYTCNFSKDRSKALCLNVAPRFSGIIGVLVVFIIGTPFLNQLIYYNANIVFPDSMKGLETLFKGWETQALATTEVILNTKSIGGLISGVLIIGVLTGIAEEFFFRGSLQKAFVKSNFNAYTAIWSTAIIFSALHFQFYGFFPRLLLGAFFGYLLYWTQSLWIPIIAHALNNSIVVVTSWLDKNGIVSFQSDQIGVVESGFPVIPLVSLLLLILFFLLGKNYFFKNNSEKLLTKRKTIKF